MRKILILIMIGFCLNISYVKANLRTDTNNYIERIDSEVAELKQALANFNTYLNNNYSLIASTLDNDTIETIGEYLKNKNYVSAFETFENKMNDQNLSSLGVKNKLEKYFRLKSDLISFVNSNKRELSFATGNEYLDCSLDLYEQIKTSFNSIKPTLSSVAEKLGLVVTTKMKNDLKANENATTEEYDDLIDEYSILGNLIANVGTSIRSSLEEYKSVFETIAVSDELFDIIIKRKFSGDFSNILDNAHATLKTAIDEFTEKRRNKLEIEVDSILAMEEEAIRKNAELIGKIDVFESINNKISTALNEIIAATDINSLKNKLNLLLTRVNNEFTTSIEYLEDHLIVGDYDIQLVEDHDEQIEFDRIHEILILDRLFTISEFRNQVELAGNLGTIQINNLNYQFVPNKSKVIVTDNNNMVQKEYDVVVKGDVNGNGAITVTDVVMTAYYSLESIELDNLEALAADENNNGKVTVTDVYLIAMKALEGGN